jgi:PAS domain S-box-containing protein
MAEKISIASMFEHAATGFAVTDAGGKVVDLNKALARIVDRGPAEIQGENLFQLTHPEDQSRHEALLQQLLAAEIPGFVIEKRYVRPDGDVVWVRNSVSVMGQEQAEPPHLVSICEDITARKRAERVLEQQEQMASVGRLTSSILHEINNPLEAIGNLIYLATHTPNASDAKAYLKQADEELGRVSQITAQGLQFHRQTLVPAPTNVISLMRSVLSLFKGKLRGAGVNIDFRSDDAPELTCFPGEIRQVFVNLISNAIESMRHGGQISIRVRPGTDWRGHERGVRITIADTGEGISPEARKHIYDAFFTTKGSQGSGIGLWVTSNIVKKHQGHIHMRSVPGVRGTVFTLVFPYRGAEGRQPGFHISAA